MRGRTETEIAAALDAVRRANAEIDAGLTRLEGIAAELRTITEGNRVAGEREHRAGSPPLTAAARRRTDTRSCRHDPGGSAAPVPPRR